MIVNSHLYIIGANEAFYCDIELFIIELNIIGAYEAFYLGANKICIVAQIKVFFLVQMRSAEFNS